MTAPGIDTQVIVVGAGPVGLMLAGELRLGGARVTVLDQLTAPTTESRASTLHARSMEILEQRGLVDRLGDPPNSGPGHFGGIPLDLTLSGPYPGQWKVPQARTEELLAGWAAELGAEVRRGQRVVGLTDRGDHVEVEVVEPTLSGGSDPERRCLHAEYVVGCDGEESTVRELAGFPFPGEDPTKELLRADIAGIDIPNRRFERHADGLAIASRGPDGVTRVMAHGYGAPARPHTGAVSFEEVSRLWARITGEDISGGTPVWLNAFGNARRQAAHYQLGRVLLAGDAAHQQMPVGGQAINLGLQDAVNLGWKLAARVQGSCGSGLLDSYHSERHPVGRRVLSNIAAQALLLLGDQDVEELRSVFHELIALPEVRAHVAGMISGLDVRYDMGDDGHPLLGTRLPAYRLRTADGSVGALGLLRRGCGVLLDLSGRSDLEGAARSLVDGRVAFVRAESEPGSTLPEFGAALIRPDGYIAWADGTPATLKAALCRWFGPPNPSSPMPV